MDMQAIEAREAEYQQETYRFLMGVRCEMREYDDTGRIDVRIRVTDDGEYDFASGDPCYDVDHRGSWGASTLSADDDETDIIDIARDMVEQAIDHAAQCA